MVTVVRRSPVCFRGRPKKTEMRTGWEVVLEYETQGPSPFLVDLSHKPKWDVQDADLSPIKPWSVPIPDKPNECVFQHGFLISRLNDTQATCWHLVGDPGPDPEGTAFTDITDALFLVALLGREVPIIIEKVCHVDFHLPRAKLPRLFQAPVFGVASRIVFLGECDGSFAVLIASDRGYAQCMVEGLLLAGQEWGLGPAGERAFIEWVSAV